MKVKYIIATIFFIWLFSGIDPVNGQTSYNNLPVLIPPAPNAAELGKYGNLDIGMQTGSLNFEVPLYSIEGNKWAMPINLQYSTSGIKVDQIASRVGLGWAFNAGGVITRNVNGQPDRPGNRSTLPADWNSFNQSFLDYLHNATGASPYNTEPDEFMYNFNGYAGKFILDSADQIVSIPHNNLKIKYLYQNSESSTITITTPDGAVYYFNTIELTSSNSTCYGSSSGPYASRLPTSWYLTRVVTPNQEEVLFTYKDCYYQYDAGISQTLTRTYDLENQSHCTITKCAAVNSESNCSSSITAWGKILTKISFRSLVIDFNYIDRQDITAPDNGIIGDQLLSNVQIRNGVQPLKTFKLNYTYAIADPYFASPYGQSLSLKYRPFLESIVEEGKTSIESRKHSFVYNDINGLPPRLSYAQDLFGYFNGQRNNSLVPVPNTDYEKQMFPGATALRNCDFSSTLKGSLTKITYPTGAVDSIFYELNEYRGLKSVPPPRDNKLVSILPTSSYPTTATSANFTPYSSENILLNGGTLISVGGGGGSNIDPLINLLRTEIVRKSDQAVVFTRTSKLGQNFSNEAITLAAGVQYFIRITSLYPNIRCSASVSYETGPSSQIEINQPTGGLRVRTFFTKDNTGILQTKNYNYSYLNDLSKSSGQQSNIPTYAKDFNTAISGNCGDGGSGGGMTVQLCKSRIMYSNSVNNIYRYSRNHIYYENVIESIGENFENGGISHSYIIEPDALSKPIWGAFLVLGVKSSNTGSRNGLEKEQLFFKKQNGAFINIKKVVNHYIVDPRVSKVVDAYVINKQYIFPLHSDPPIYEEFNGYEINKYSFYSKWVYKDSTSVYNYNEDGSILLSKTGYQYPNVLHTQIGKETISTSDGLTREVNYKYPHEMVSLGRDPNGIYQGMITRNIISPVVEQTIVKNGKTSLERRNFIQPFSNIYVPGSVDVLNTVSNTDETRIRYQAYDNKGNPLSLAQEKGAKINYIWSYNGQYPIAEIKNADYSSVVSALGGGAAITAFSIK
ncbi:hypothetical protein, partial [Pedobacter sp.]|uniref:hypothetical protein n=1 Tax=Pedobacter sp. TaxID=1411316 RepID=UPI002B6AF501